MYVEHWFSVTGKDDARSGFLECGSPGKPCCHYTWHMWEPNGNWQTLLKELILAHRDGSDGHFSHWRHKSRSESRKLGLIGYIQLLSAFVHKVLLNHSHIVTYGLKSLLYINGQGEQLQEFVCATNPKEIKEITSWLFIQQVDQLLYLVFFMTSPKLSELSTC